MNTPLPKTARTIDADAKTHRFYLPCNVADEAGKTTFSLLVVGAAK